MVVAANPLTKLDARRRQLGMTIDVVAKRSGVSRATVERVLSGRYGSASFDTVQQIASALGATVEIANQVDPYVMLEQQAILKAEELMRIVQGTSALEGQGVSEATYVFMLKQAVHRLLAGPKRRLWT
jgi:transcriptional regulator with XRE-family HTH domain